MGLFDWLAGKSDSFTLPNGDVVKEGDEISVYLEDESDDGLFDECFMGKVKECFANGVTVNDYKGRERFIRHFKSVKDERKRFNQHINKEEV